MTARVPLPRRRWTGYMAIRSFAGACAPATLRSFRSDITSIKINLPCRGRSREVSRHKLD